MHILYIGQNSSFINYRYTFCCNYLCNLFNFNGIYEQYFETVPLDEYNQQCSNDGFVNFHLLFLKLVKKYYHCMILALLYFIIILNESYQSFQSSLSDCYMLEMLKVYYYERFHCSNHAT